MVVTRENRGGSAQQEEEEVVVVEEEVFTRENRGGSAQHATEKGGGLYSEECSTIVNVRNERLPDDTSRSSYL